MVGLCEGGNEPPGSLKTINCLKTRLNLTSDIKKSPFMRQLDQEIMGRLAAATEEKRLERLHQVLLQHDNASPHSANMTKTAIEKLGTYLRDRRELNKCTATQRRKIALSERDKQNLTSNLKLMAKWSFSFSKKVFSVVQGYVEICGILMPLKNGNPGHD
ncbi:hypothetical protein ANN_09820 [Periplaneta americana]|uniref:Histone-lysine N-methyltransferase SETMAR n=1 Tax=Periplaneta americana TaxID=6978 RepID=A0ABQ8TQ08_PERAM|nr:hypothetical protein ANN_09820 [Periplaneta americana]